MKLTARLQRAAAPYSTLRQRNFALVWCSITLGGMGAQMETVVMGWYLLTLTNSPFLVGLMGAARLGANILALFAGAITDRIARHLILAASQFVMCVFAVLILVLIISGHLEVWHIFAITFVTGLSRIFQMPAGQSLAADSVSDDRISNGVALINTGMNLNLVVGPYVGGRLFEQFGPEVAYALIASLYFVGGTASLLIRVSRSANAQQRESVWRTVLNGLSYVKSKQVLWAALVVAVIINLTGFPFHVTLMPVFARDVLGTDAEGLGKLLSAFGIGALVGSFMLASVQNLKHVGKLAILAVVVWHGSMVLFSLSTSFPLSMAILVLTGIGFSSTLVLILTVLLRNSLTEYRGRIMGLRVLAIYAHAFGSPASGAIAGIWSAPVAATFNATLGTILVAVLALIAPKLRKA